MKKKVEGFDDTYKDENTGVISQGNSTERNRYRIAKKAALQALDTEHELIEIKKEMSELSELKDEVKELKDLLREMLGKWAPK